MLPLVVWVVALVAGTTLFHAMGDGPLAAPPLDPSTWSAWVAGRDPLVATVAVLRLVVLGLSWYLVGATSIGILARLLRAARLVRLADALTVPALRRLLQGALGVSLATAMVTAATPQLPTHDGADVAPSTATLALDSESDDEVSLASRADRPDPADRAGQVTLTAAGAEQDEVALAHAGQDRPLPLDLLELDAERPSADADDAAADATRPVSDDTGSVDDVDDGQLDDHVVVEGESLWSIAYATLVAGTDAEPSDAQVADYWQRVIEENRDRLDDPDNPDLIFPGQRFALPTLDGAET